jgi:hypothetical protein
MAVRQTTSTGAAAKPTAAAPQATQTVPAPSLEDVRNAANKAVMNKLLEPMDAAPPGVNASTGVPLQVSRKDQQESQVISRIAYAMEGMLYIQDVAMKTNGDTVEVWRRGTKPL